MTRAATITTVQRSSFGNSALIIGASSVGTVFEWYDFFLYGSMAAIFGRHFFSAVNEVTGFIFALLAFAAGFAVRPLGGVIFGRMGDVWGRKNTFLVTMFLMGSATFGVGLLPTYETAGFLAPALLILARLLQGLAMGGEYGGAAIYVAEHAPRDRRGLHTSFIQVTATAGLFLSLLMVLATRRAVGEDAFASWGWRIPFLASAALLAVSIWIRLKLNESPAFQALLTSAGRPTRPLAEALTEKQNLGRILAALFGLCAGMTVVWYTGQFYVLFFLENVLKLDGASANLFVAAALLFGTPFFVIFGWLSDKIGRKPVILAGCALAAATYFPLFHGLTAAVNPALAEASQRAPVVVAADPRECTFQFDPVGKSKFLSSCDIAKSALASAGVGYVSEDLPKGAPAMVRIGQAVLATFDGRTMAPKAAAAQKRAFSERLSQALLQAHYPVKADPAHVDASMTIGILSILVIFATMTYGPLAAALAEMFPTRVRYTAVSIPYNIATGWIGGFLPAAAFAMVAAQGNIYFGLWYPVIISAVTVLVGVVAVKDLRGAVLDEHSV